VGYEGKKKLTEKFDLIIKLGDGGCGVVEGRYAKRWGKGGRPASRAWLREVKGNQNGPERFPKRKRQKKNDPSCNQDDAEGSRGTRGSWSQEGDHVTSESQEEKMKRMCFLMGNVKAKQQTGAAAKKAPKMTKEGGVAVTRGEVGPYRWSQRG